MVKKILIDRVPFDKLVISVPEDVYDPQSYIRGVEDILSLLRKAKVENEEEDLSV